MRAPRSFWLLLLLITLGFSAEAATWIRDDAGVSAPPTNYIGTGGAQQTVNASNRLPVQTATEAAGAATSYPTTSATDPAGWGTRWFTGSLASSATNTTAFASFVSDNMTYGFTVAAGNTVDVLRSFDRGRTWTTLWTLNFGVGWSNVYWVMRQVTPTATTPLYLIGGDCGAGLTPTCTGMGSLSVAGSGQQVALPGLPAGISVKVVTIAQQGSTVLAKVVKGADGSSYMCRSTDSGTTFSCEGSSYGGSPVAGGESVAAVSAGIWLRTYSGFIQRSTNDGLAWANVANPGGAVSNVVHCISSTICLYVQNDATIWRSTNGGATWANSFSALGTGPAFAGLADFGSGVVAALPSTANSGTWITRDSGATWNPGGTLTGNQQRCAQPCQAVVYAGSAIFTGQPVTQTDKFVYSAALGQGSSNLVGANGAMVNMDASGNVGIFGSVGQGAGWDGSTNVPWQTIPVQGSTLLNSSTTGAAATPVVVTLTGSANRHTHLWSLDAYCSAGTATLTVQDGATTIWAVGAVVPAAPSVYTRTWPTALTAALGNNVVITLGACGAGNTGTLNVQGDRF